MDRKFFDKLIVGVVVLALGVFAAGCGSSKSKSGGGSTADVNSAGLDVNGCKPATQPAAKKVKLKKPSERLDRSRRYTAVFQTNCGEFSVLLDVKRNPKTAASFAYLVKRDVYVNTWFHRIVSDFVAQGGEPPGTSGSQFFIVTGQQGTALPPDYAIAGTVVNGADTIQRIAGYAAPQGAQSEAPTGVALITKATLIVK